MCSNAAAIPTRFLFLRCGMGMRRRRRRRRRRMRRRGEVDGERVGMG